MKKIKRPTVRVAPTELKALIVRLLKAYDCAEALADCAATVFVEADLRGTGGQGIDYLPYILDNLKKGNIDPRASPSVARDVQAVALIDGHRGLGQPAAVLASKLAARKAKQFGTAVVGVTNSTDIFMIGYYADLIAAEGLAALVFTSGPPLVHPYGGVERMLSTNPIAFGFPTGRAAPMICDVSTSASSSWRIRQAAYHDERVAAGTGIDRKGKPTRSAKDIRKGAIGPLGGHKGFGLGLSVAVMSGLLVGSQVGPDLGGWQDEGPIGYFGHTFMAIDPALLNPDADFATAVGGYIDRIKGSKKAAGFEEILIPGERSYRDRARNLSDGVPVLSATWRIIGKLAGELDVRMPKTR
jgi:LDH2 family malate/lactate/ureidoglycolate dehydrogenase